MEDKKLKIWTWIVNIVLVILDISVIIYRVVNKNFERIMVPVLFCFTMLIPYVLNRTKFRIGYKYKLSYSAFLFLSYFLGSVINLYDKFAWYDLFIHFLSGIFTLVMAYYVLNKTKYKNMNGIIKFIYCIGLVALVAVLWEIIEFTADNLFGMNTQHNIEVGVVDTMTDMIMGLLGGLFGYFTLPGKKFKD